MKTFKNYLNEDIWNLSHGGVRAEPKTIFKSFGYDVKDFGPPVHSMGDYDLHQLHFGVSGHRGFGRYVDKSKNQENPLFYEGGHFALVHRPTGEYAGHMSYIFDPRNSELKVKDLLATEGHKNVRNMIYDSVADRLGYTIVSDWGQTSRGKRGWMTDIEKGHNVKIRKLDKQDDVISEYPAKGVDPKEIWTTTDPQIGDKVLLVRYPNTAKSS